jgi:hypothetical protein
MFPANRFRVAENTADSVNQQIARQTEENVRRVAAGGLNAIDRRLKELDEEWDIERCVETMAPTFTLLGIGLGLTVSRRWFLLPIAVQSFFLQHALQGWCPPIPLLRSLGVRTMDEINQERTALKALRGDFQQVKDGSPGRLSRQAERALQAVRN